MKTPRVPACVPQEQLGGPWERLRRGVCSCLRGKEAGTKLTWTLSDPIGTPGPRALDSPALEEQFYFYGICYTAFSFQKQYIFSTKQLLKCQGKHKYEPPLHHFLWFRLLSFCCTTCLSILINTDRLGEILPNHYGQNKEFKNTNWGKIFSSYH